ncbi:TPA: hypothetical protein BOS_23217 [Bos taurus]|nr:TPA: hypothetical protein BOS_23217 [Bos taurus]
MLTSYATPERSASPNFLEGQVAFSHPRLSNNRSVMPLDVRGCTRATLTGSACAYPTPAGAGNPLNPIRDGDRGLQLFPMNEEFPVSAGHKLALIKSLPFVHTARRYYRLDGLVRPSDRPRRGRAHGPGGALRRRTGARRTRAKAFAKNVFINQERKSEVRRRSDTVVVPTINDADWRCGGVIPMTRRAASGKPKSLGSGGSMVAKLKLKGIDGRAPPGVEPAA